MIVDDYDCTLASRLQTVRRQARILDVDAKMVFINNRKVQDNSFSVCCQKRTKTLLASSSIFELS